jgi:hypothetical protein
MFKSELLKYYFEIENRNKYLMPDYLMWLSFCPYTEFYYLPETMATYRVLEASASRFNNYIKEIDFLNSYIEIKYFFIEKYSLINYDKNEVENYYNYKKLNILSKHNKYKEIKYLRNSLKPQNTNQRLIKIFSKYPILLKIYFHLLSIYLKNY